MLKNDFARCHFYIVTPSYNQGQFIEQSIKSVLGQKNIKLSYWVIDGGSTDKTVSILKKYSSQIEWVSEPDQGQTDAINKGIKAILKNKHNDELAIFGFINSDDYYLSQSLKRVASEFLLHPEINWLVGDALIVNERSAEIQSPIRLYKKFWRWIFFPSLLKILNPIPQPATFIRLEALKQTGLFKTKLRYTMDYEYWLRLQQKFGSPHFISTPLAAFRIHGASKGGSQFINQFAEQYQVAKKYCQHNWVLNLHRLHNWLIVTIYKLIK